jgi:hypothetical protein
MADLWAVYFHRFQEVVTAEMREQSTVSPECPQDEPIGFEGEVGV